jgi:hypothetical protein
VDVIEEDEEEVAAVVAVMLVMASPKFPQETTTRPFITANETSHEAATSVILPP